MSVEDRLASTLRGCPGALGKQERWLTEFLISDPEWRLAGKRLTLTSGQGEIELHATGG